MELVANSLGINGALAPNLKYIFFVKNYHFGKIV